MSDAYAYVGEELDLFAAAVNWKRYLARHLQPSIQGDVLEVGAGIGATTRLLCRGTENSWTCLEPDPGLAGRLADSLRARPLPLEPVLVIGTLANLPDDQRFDCLLYVDVLEHIEDDAGEVRAAAQRLQPGGRLVVLAPAHQSLYTAFDRNIGHFRRYDKAMMRKLGADGLELERLFYLDSAGLLASLSNRLLLKSGMPTAGQIRIWDRMIVPVSRVLDPLVGHALGKSVVAIWRHA